jgi:hypothetical protein
MRRNRRVWTVALLLAALAALPATAKQMERWTANYPLAVGGRVSVANVQGSIKVKGWDRARVQLTVEKTTTGDPTRLSEVEISVEPRGDAFHVETLYTGSSDEPVVVDYTLRVPRQVWLESLRTVNGNILVREVEGAIDAQTLNGNIKQIGVAGSARAHTVNGSVTVSLRALPEPPAALQLETINGDLRLLLPSAANAELELSTVAGRIDSDFFSAASAVHGDTSVRARLGRGGVRIRLRTVRGNIQVAENDDVL